MTLPKDIEEAIDRLAISGTQNARNLHAYDLRPVISRHLSRTPTQRQRYKEQVIAGLLANECTHDVPGDAWMSDYCGKLADLLLSEDAEHAKKQFQP